MSLCLRGWESWPVSQWGLFLLPLKCCGDQGRSWWRRKGNFVPILKKKRESFGDSFLESFKRVIQEPIGLSASLQCLEKSSIKSSQKPLLKRWKTGKWLITVSMDFPRLRHTWPAWLTFDNNTSGFVDKGIAVGASDLHSDQDSFLTCLHSWWLVYQGQKR